MGKIYKKHCDNCGKYYEGYGKKYCGYSCANKINGFQKGHKLRVGNKTWLGRKHTEASKRKMSKISKPKGEDSPSWKGGKYKSRNRWYVRELNHPFAQPIWVYPSSSFYC